MSVSRRYRVAATMRATCDPLLVRKAETRYVVPMTTPPSPTGIPALTAARPMMRLVAPRKDIIAAVPRITTAGSVADPGRGTPSRRSRSPGRRNGFTTWAWRTPPPGSGSETPRRSASRPMEGASGSPSRSSVVRSNHPSHSTVSRSRPPASSGWSLRLTFAGLRRPSRLRDEGGEEEILWLGGRSAVPDVDEREDVDLPLHDVDARGDVGGQEPGVGPDVLAQHLAAGMAGEADRRAGRVLHRRDVGGDDLDE